MYIYILYNLFYRVQVYMHMYIYILCLCDWKIYQLYSAMCQYDNVRLYGLLCNIHTYIYVHIYINPTPKP